MSRFAFFCGLLAIVASGCSPYDSSVYGTLSLDGNPLDRGTVTFHPEAGSATAYAQVKEDGTFRAQVGGERGLPSGAYGVGVRVVEEIPPKIEGDPPGFRSIIPLKYKNYRSSGLRFDIKKGKNTIEIDLKSDN